MYRPSTCFCVSLLLLAFSLVPSFCDKDSRNNKVSDGKEICDLPHVTGPCRAYMPRWAYSSEKKKCVEFIYGGCLGNANNFYTQQECLSHCKDV